MAESVNQGGMDITSMMSMMMPVLLQLLTQNQSTGNRTYAPISYVPGHDLAPGGSLTSLMGTSPGLGMGLNMIAPMLGIDINRFQFNQNENQILRYQQLQMQQTLGRYNFQSSANDVAASLGMTPGGMGAQMLGPMLAMSPELQRVAGALSPTSAFNAGQNISFAAQMMNPTGRLDMNQFNAVAKAYEDFTIGTRKDGSRFLNTVNTQGMSRDDFGTFMTMASDLALVDTDFTPEARSAMRRNGSTEQQIRAEGLMRATRNQAGIGRVIANTLMPGANAGEQAQLMQEMGLTATSGKESETIRGLLYELKALGDAAHMSTQQMMNAGRVLQSKFGGALTTGMEAAAIGGMARRSALEQGADIRVADVTGERMAEEHARSANSRYKTVEMAIKLHGTESQKARLLELQRGAGTIEGAAAVDQYLEDVRKSADPRDRAILRSVASMRANDPAMYLANVEREARTASADLTRPGTMVEDNNAQIARAMAAFSKADRPFVEGLEPIMDQLLSDPNLPVSPEAAGIKGGEKYERILRLSNTPAWRAYRDARGQRSNAQNAVNEARKQNAVMTTADKVQDSLRAFKTRAPVDVIKRAISSGNVMNALEEAGIAQFSEWRGVLDTLDKDKALVPYMQSILDSVADQGILDDKSATAEQKAAATERLKKSQDLQTATEMRAQTGKAGDPSEVSQSSGRMPGRGSASMLDEPKRAKPMEPSTDTGSEGSKGSDKVELSITIYDQNGKLLPAAEASATGISSATSNTREFVLTGKTSGGRP